MAIALTSHHSTRIHIVPDRSNKPNKGVWIFCNLICPFFGTYRFYTLSKIKLAPP